MGRSLDPELVEKIKNDLRDTTISYLKIAHRHGVSTSTVYNIDRSHVNSRPRKVGRPRTRLDPDPKSLAELEKLREALSRLKVRKLAMQECNLTSAAYARLYTLNKRLDKPPLLSEHRGRFPTRHRAQQRLIRLMNTGMSRQDALSALSAADQRILADG